MPSAYCYKRNNKENRFIKEQEEIILLTGLGLKVPYYPRFKMLVLKVHHLVMYYFDRNNE